LENRKISREVGKITFSPEFERALICERVTAGVRNAQANGTRSGRPIGRPPAHVDAERAYELQCAGESWGAIARILGSTRPTIRRVVEGVSKTLQEQAREDHVNSGGYEDF